MSAQIASHPF